MAKVLYERDGRIARITLNRPEVMNAIDDELPGALADAVARADNDPGAHVIVLAGAGRAFCAGYDLTAYASGDRANRYTQEMPWDPMKDYACMCDNTEQVHEPVPLQAAGDLQGARLCGGRRLRHRAVLRHDRDGGGCAHRLYAGSGLGLSDHGDVGLSARRRRRPSACCSPATRSPASRRRRSASC